MDNQESLTSSAAPKPTFETLPTEIRLKVYDNLIGDAAIILDFETEPQNRRYSSSIKLSDEASETAVKLFLKKQVSLLSPHSISPTILAVSKKINAESTPVLYSENTFIIPYYRLEDVQTFFFIRIGQKNRDLIKNIEIHFSTPELWAAIGPNAWRRPVLSAIVPRCLKRLAMVHDWISTPPIDKRMSQGNQDLTMMANFLNMNIEYMPWLSKMAMRPGRQVSILEEGTLVKRGQERRIQLGPRKRVTLGYTRIWGTLDPEKESAYVDLISTDNNDDISQTDVEDDQLENAGVEEGLEQKHLVFMDEIQEL